MLYLTNLSVIHILCKSEQSNNDLTLETIGFYFFEMTAQLKNSFLRHILRKLFSILNDTFLRKFSLTTLFSVVMIVVMIMSRTTIILCKIGMVGKIDCH